MKTKPVQFFILLICVVLNFSCKEKVDAIKLESTKKYSPPPFISLKINNVNLLKIGDTLNLVNLPESTNEIVTGSGGLANHYLTEIDNIEFDLGISSDRIVKFIATDDKNFITQENLKIGDLYGRMKFSAFSEPIYESGFALFVKLDSGWKASLKVENFDEEFDKTYLNREIDFFFRK